MMLDNELKTAAAILGRRGGLIGGKRCLVTMSPEARIARATLASAAARVVNLRKSAERKAARLNAGSTDPQAANAQPENTP
jgi:hypothetical protein